MSFSVYGYLSESVTYWLVNILVRIELGSKLYNEIKKDGKLDELIDKYLGNRDISKHSVETSLKFALLSIGYNPELIEI